MYIHGPTRELREMGDKKEGAGPCGRRPVSNTSDCPVILYDVDLIFRQVFMECFPIWRFATAAQA